MKILLASLMLFALSPVEAKFSKIAKDGLPKTVNIHVNGRHNGTGVFIDNKGTVLTAAHLFTQPKIQIFFGSAPKKWTPKVTAWVHPGHAGYTMKIVKQDRVKDLALLVPTQPFKTPYAKLGETVEIAEEVLVIGSPYEFYWSVTTGIVSRLGGKLRGRDLTQSDAAINPGNSGGPLFNMKGQLIGIASSIYTDGGMFNGISFFVNLEAIKKFLGGK